MRLARLRKLLLMLGNLALQPGLREGGWREQDRSGYGQPSPAKYPAPKQKQF